MKFSLKDVTTAIGAIVAIVTAVALPAAYSPPAIPACPSRACEAELNAGYLAKYINSHAALWQFQNVRIAELLSQTDAADSNFKKRVVDSSNRTVLDAGDPAAMPTLARRKPVSIAGSTVAYVELEASLQPLMRHSLLVALFSGLLGLGIFFTLRIFPLRVLDRTLGELERSNGALAQINERFKAALTHMSHGLSMFDARGDWSSTTTALPRCMTFHRSHQGWQYLPDFLQNRLCKDTSRRPVDHGEKLPTSKSR
jgi:hypothetical protein